MQAGASFVSVTQQFNTTHSMGRLTLNILLSFAQFEREIISERTRDKIAAARRKGKWSGGKPMLGYDIQGPAGATKLVVNDAEAEQVRTIYRLYLEKQSLIQLARELNRRGWTTKQWTTRRGRLMGGKPYDKGNLFKLITNALYVGKVRYKEELHPGEHAAIIDEVTWQQTQSLLRLNGRTGGAHIRNKYGALLKGILYCRPCGLAMGHTFTGKGNRRYRYYTCYGAQKRGWDACPSKSVPAEQIEQFVVKQVKAMCRSPEIRSLVLEQFRSQGGAEIETLESEAQIVEREIGWLHAEIRRTATKSAPDGSALPQLAELHERVAEAERRRTALREQIVTARRENVTKAEIDAALDEFDSLWESLCPREQIRMLRTLIKRVDYDGGEGKVAITFHSQNVRSLGRTSESHAVEVA